MNGDTECAKFLIQSKCDANHRDINGQTALYCAFHGGHMDMALVLVRCGGTLSMRDNDDKSPFHYAPPETKLMLAQILTNNKRRRLRFKQPAWMGYMC